MSNPWSMPPQTPLLPGLMRATRTASRYLTVLDAQRSSTHQQGLISVRSRHSQFVNPYKVFGGGVKMKKTAKRYGRQARYRVKNPKVKSGLKAQS